MTREERISIDNGIWLCAKCAHIVDNDDSYTVETLRQWKQLAEDRATLDLLGSDFANQEQTNEIHLSDRWFSRRSGYSEKKVSFGFRNVDRICTLMRASVVLVAGQEVFGPNLYVQNIVRYNAIRNKAKVIYFSLKYSKNTMLNMFLAAEGMVSYDSLLSGKLEEDDWQRVTLAASSLSNCEMILEEYDVDRSMQDYICAAVRNGNADFVVIDDFDALGLRGKAEINAFMYQLRSIASSNGTSVFIILETDEPRRQDRRPMLTDSQVSDIARLCDVVQFVFHDGWSQEIPKGELEVIVAKCGLQQYVGTAYLMKLDSCGLIADYEKEDTQRVSFADKYPGVITGINHMKKVLDIL